jgi:hypothetical protein
MTKREQILLDLMNSKEKLRKKDILILKKLIFQSDVNLQNKFKENMLMCFLYHWHHQFSLKKDEWDYLLKNTDLKMKDAEGLTVLMYIFTNGEKYKFTISEEDLNYLIDHSDINQKNKVGYNAFMYYLIHQPQNINMNPNQIKKMYNHLYEEEKQKTFNEMIYYFSRGDKEKYHKIIKMFLYDLDFRCTKNTMKWLENDQYKEVTDHIEKRNLYFSLKNHLSEEKTEKKALKI